MMKKTAILLLFLVLTAMPAWGGTNGYTRHVVEVNVTFQSYDPMKPWAKGNPGARQTAAVVVAGPYLLTTAQMVEDATFIEAKKFGGPGKKPAHIAHVDPEINLALLTVEGEGFYDDLEPVKIAGTAPVAGVVSSVRWKCGQREVSTSRVARVEVRQSFISDLEHMLLRVKSDLGGGGWAEPVFKEEELAGLTVSQDEDLADVMPPELVAAYLRETQNKDGYRGFGNLGFTWQNNEDHALATALGLTGAPRGIIILNVPWGATGCNILKPRDILLSLGGYEIDSMGYYTHPTYGRLRINHLAVDGHQAGDVLRALVLREGQITELSVTLRRFKTRDRLIPWSLYNIEPAYLVAGGLVFRELDGEYFAAWGEGWQQKGDLRLVTFWNRERNAQTPDRRRIVVLSYVLPSAYNIGYHELENLAVTEVNGMTVDSLADVEEGLSRLGGDFHSIRLLPNRMRNEIVIDAATFENATKEILSLYNIPTRRRLPPPPADLDEIPCAVPAAGER